MRSVWFFLLLLSVVVLSCDSLVGPALDPEILPAVLATGTNYRVADLQRVVPDSTLWHRFAEAYAGKYSQALKDALVEHIVSVAGDMHLNENQLRDCLAATGQLSDAIHALPYRAEFAKIEGTRSWIMEFAWSPDTTLGHFRCYGISTTRLDTLAFLTCD